ncbi:MAG: ABC-type transport auxiliary lipoprotein family protein [Pseudomonadota bacterium]
MTKTLFSIALLTTALTACVSVLPEPEVPDALYKVDASAAHPGLTENIIVREPEAARLIAGQGMVSARDDGGLRLISGAEWAGPATRQIQFAMIDSFGPGADGHALAPELGAVAQYELASRIADLKLEGTRATCRMMVSVIRTTDRNLLARTEVSADSTARSRSSVDRAIALRSAASDCAAQASLFAIEALSDGS